MHALIMLSRAIDFVNARLGRVANWMILIACLISAANAMIRYAFDISSNAWLEVQWYLFAGVVMLGASYTLQRNEHVRVDILYTQLSERGKEWLDLIGTAVFLIPSCLPLPGCRGRSSTSPGTSRRCRATPAGSCAGRSRYWCPLGFVLLALQGVSEIIKRGAALHGDVRYETHYERPVQ